MGTRRRSSGFSGGHRRRSSGFSGGHRRRSPGFWGGHRRRSPGFWGGLTKAAHLDHLRHRIGGAVGRSIIRTVNKGRARKGKSPIPMTPDWFGRAPVNVSPSAAARAASPKTASPKTASPAPATHANKPAATIPIRVRQQSRTAPGKYQGPNNWNGMGVKTQPLNRTGQARNGSAGQPVNQPTPAHAVPPSHPQGPDMTTPAPATTTPAAAPPAVFIQAGQVSPGDGCGTVGKLPGPCQCPSCGGPPQDGKSATAPSSTGGNTMSATEFSVPETDAQHMSWCAEYAIELGDMAERLAEHRELLESERNMHSSIMAGLDSAAESLGQAAEGITSHAQDYEAMYADVRQVAEATGGKVPGMAPDDNYWTETA